MASVKFLSNTIIQGNVKIINEPSNPPSSWDTELYSYLLDNENSISNLQIEFSEPSELTLVNEDDSNISSVLVNNFISNQSLTFNV